MRRDDEARMTMGPSTSNALSAWLPYLPPRLRQRPWRLHPLDGKLLLFDRQSGLNVLLEGEETSHFRRLAPRVLLVAVTNACNLACSFCYRDQTLRSHWTSERLLQLCRDADAWGVLEVAFGGGEPTLLLGWGELLASIHATTGLCVNFTTNGTRLSDELLEKIAGTYGQIRLSLYDDNDWPVTVARLVRSRARFGVNWLITPAQLARFEATMLRLLALGARDILLLRYKGADLQLHLSPQERQRLATLVRRLHEQLSPPVTLKLDSCWGSDLGPVPRLATPDDCEAGDAFLSIASDGTVAPCSFQHAHVPYKTLGDLRTVWEAARAARAAAPLAGCARRDGGGWIVLEDSDAHQRLAAVQQQP
jgi:MoaA/NifB/PqqE/SkfB family radical SAM enzyme